MVNLALGLGAGIQAFKLFTHESIFHGGAPVSPELFVAQKATFEEAILHTPPPSFGTTPPQTSSNAAKRLAYALELSAYLQLNNPPKLNPVRYILSSSTL